jgi:putative hydrolase
MTTHDPSLWNPMQSQHGILIHATATSRHDLMLFQSLFLEEMRTIFDKDVGKEETWLQKANGNWLSRMQATSAMCAARRMALSARLSMSVNRSLPTSGPKLKRRFPKVRATAATRSGSLLDNASIAELLSREAVAASGHLKLAFKRAARAAFRWPEEAAHIVAAGRSLTELEGIGPSLARRLHAWFESPPAEVDPPPIRSEFLTLAQARRILTDNPEWNRLLQGDLQMHTVWSDGSGTISVMAEAAIKVGYQYIAITDHTKGLKIAGGVDEVRLEQQGREIMELNRRFGERGTNFRILRSAELNLSPSGEGDMEPSALQNLDLVLGCFHSALRRTEDQTGRYIAALQNPDIQILGHPQTRIYDHRVGLQADWHKVFAKAARLDKALEIDGYADRQDLRLSLLKIARKEGARISLGTDAHHPEQLSYIELSLEPLFLRRSSQNESLISKRSRT